MINRISTIFTFTALLGFGVAQAQTTTYQVGTQDIHNGYVIERIPLSQFVKPDVQISGINYEPNVTLPKDAKTGEPGKPEVVMGMEKKQPFMVVRIPAYTAGDATGHANRVSSFTLNITEPATGNTPKSAARTTDASSSVLATGTWFKVAVPATGFYKIDFNFITSMGLNPANINPANIRVFGNGGNMLSEDNKVQRPSDLLENAIWVSGNGDNVFDNGEFAVFYAIGPTEWDKDSVNQRFTHQKNLYTDTAYYFITFDQGPGKRLAAQPATGTANVYVDSFNYYDVHDTDITNPSEMGKLWYGESFYAQIGNTTQSFDFNLGSSVNNLTCTVCFVIAGSALDAYSVSVNNNTFGSYTYPQGTNGDDIYFLNTSTWTGPCNSDNANVTINFAPVDNTSIGYLNYIELNGRRALGMASATQMGFRDWKTVGSGNIATYRLQGANSSTQVWDITDPQNAVLMNGSLSGTTYTFTQDAARLHEFVAMNGTGFSSPKFIGQVVPQNLHGQPQADLIIVTNPEFLTQANQLADYHRQHDNMRVNVATTDQVYNEFSSGGQDISAIRDYARMFYKRGGTDPAQLPGNLLLFGGASYDYKNRVANNSDFVPVFESAESFNDLNSFSSDDFYGFLDDNENIEDYSQLNTLDVGIGRLPARSVADATAMVNKILNYATVTTLGPWRVSTTHVADKGCDDSAGDHMDDADSMATQVARTGKRIYNEEKVYVDALPIISTPAGGRCPDANAAIDAQVFQGTFLINYNGHGNPLVWSSERILTEDDFNNWNNLNSLPFMVTATCDFGRFDHPEFVSSAEQLVERANGGVIAVMTTTQAVYATYNHELNIQYLASQFSRNADNSWKNFGQASRAGKNVTYATSNQQFELVNFYKFALLGDPAVTPDFPKYSIKLDTISDAATLQQADTVKALGSYNVSGSVRDFGDNVLSSFNGMLSVAFYDKPRSITTISGCNEVYQEQDNIIYKGRVTVTNGQFSFSFIAPKDLNYYFGEGKLSFYADDGVATDAAGVDTTINVGGYSEHPNISSNPPVVKPYINDTLFQNGGVTGANTSLYVTLFDETGINVSGTAVGHDLTAVLDGNIESPYILNNYYQTLPNTYQRGFVSFPVSGLADGKHTFTVKAWDVNDNTGQGTVNFTVVDGNVMDVQQLSNYPNPFNNTTTFVFEHNHPFEDLNVELDIFSTSGASVKSIKQDFTASDSRTTEITWDGTDNHGARLPSGVYVYRMSVTSDKGFKTAAYQKLVIVR